MSGRGHSSSAVAPAPPGVPAGPPGGRTAPRAQEGLRPDMAVVERQVTIQNVNGLHARPAMQFVDCATGYESDITVARPADHPEGPAEVDAKSVMQMLTLFATQGTTLTLRADGPDADAALEALVRMVEGKFGEDS